MKVKKANGRMFDAASGPMLLVIVGIPIIIIVAVVVLVFVASTLIKRASNKNIEAKRKQDNNDSSGDGE